MVHFDETRRQYQLARIAHWSRLTGELDRRGACSRYYHRRLAAIYRFLIPPNQRVLELGCGRGDLLSAVQPGVGVGVDFAPPMIAAARSRHPGLTFIEADAHTYVPVARGESFDYIILSDLINELWDVQAVFAQIRRYCDLHTRIVLNFYSRVWQWPLQIAEKLGVAQLRMEQNWLAPADVANLLYLEGLEIVGGFQDLLCPAPIPLAATALNRFAAKIAPLRWASLTNVVVARPIPQPVERNMAPTVSVIVPARNEQGNIAALLDRTADLSGNPELIFVEGGSTDDTRGEIERQITARPKRQCRLLQQSGRGKADAVRLGFAHATGEIVLILDADLSVPPEDLPRFIDALISGRGEFINGVRLVYPMQQRAMRFLNLHANKFFSLAFTWVLGQPIKDTLCGTKALWKRDYERIAANRAYFGDFDPFGDFDLIFGAAKLNLKLVDMPIRYRQRTFGETNIHRFRHGWLLLKMLLFAARRIKFF